MSVRLGAPALCRPLKYSRESGLSGARCSCHADQAAISGAVRLCFAWVVDPFQNLGVAFL